MNLLQEQSRALRILIVLALVIEGVPATARCQEGAKISNVHYEATSDSVVVHFDLLGTASDEYRIDLFLRSEKDPTFRYQPRNIHGDLRPGTNAGVDRQIVWYLKGEFPQGIEGSDYYFEVRAERLSSFNGMLLWIGAGVAVLGTIAAVHLFGSGSGDTPADNSQFPTPPGRP